MVSRAPRVILGAWDLRPCRCLPRVPSSEADSRRRRKARESAPTHLWSAAVDLPRDGGLAAACSDAAGPDPVLLEVVAGDGQEAQVGTPVADPLVVHVMRLDSLPRAGIPVDWTVLEGGGVVEPSAASSDAEGTVQASWMLGSEPGQQVVRVTAGGEGVDLRAWATPPPPEEWSEVIEIRPVAEIEGETLLASVRLYNRWPGTLQLTTMTGCITPWEYPALYAGTGERVAGPTSLHLRGNHAEGPAGRLPWVQLVIEHRFGSAWRLHAALQVRGRRNQRCSRYAARCGDDSVCP